MSSNSSSSGDTTSGRDAAVGIVAIVVGGAIAVAMFFFIYKCAKARHKSRQRATERMPVRQRLATMFSDLPRGSGGGEGAMTGFLEQFLRDKPARFTSEDLEFFTGNYMFKVGSGGFGTVYRGQFPNRVPVAVKVLNESMNKRAAEAQFMAEVGTIGRTYHVNLVKLYGFCFEPELKALVYEFMENGSLENFIFGDNRNLSFGKLYDIAVGTAKGIRYLHEECEQRIIHYDIKPANILLDAGFVPKVGDFGLAKLCDREKTHLTITGARGTPGYAAPELWMPQMPVTHKCDVYSFGMVLFEIVGRRRNVNVAADSLDWYPRWLWQSFEKGDMEVVFNNSGIEGEERERAERMCKVALWCVQYQPDDRPDIGKVIRMLEGEEDEAIPTPANPFVHWDAMAATATSSSTLNSVGTTTTDTSTSPILPG